MPNWIWPRSSEATSLSIRTGRVIYWFLTTLAVAGFLAMAASIVAYGGGLDEVSGSLAYLVGLGALGRALRYILSNE
jgi:hypothetical protein